MKKFLSILLVVMLVLSMIPATVYAADETVSIDFTNASNRTQSSTTQQVWEQNGIKVTYAKGNYTNNLAEYNPVRFYAGTKVTIAYPGMMKLVFECVSGYADDLKAATYPSGVTATYSGNVVTVTSSAAIDSITITMTKQVRVNALEITASGSTCNHSPVEQNDGQAATCTATGWTNSFVCSKCGETTIARIESPMIPHNYVSGKCTMCQKTEPQGYEEIDLSEDGFYEDVVIVGTKNGATYALPSTEATSKGSVVVQEVTVVEDVLEVGDLRNVQWDVTVSNGVMTFQPADNTELYLYCLSDNNGVRVSSRAEREGYETFVMENNYLKNVNRGRYLGVYLTQDWRCYTSHTTANIANQTFAFYAPKQASEEDLPYIGKDNTEYETLGEAIAAGNPVKAVSGEELPKEFILNPETETPQRFVTLGADDEGFYTYYELSLELTNVSLRSSEAGIYYTAKINAKDFLEAIAEKEDVSYGIMLSLEGTPTKLVAGQYTSVAGVPANGTAFLSGSVFGIFDKDLGGEQNQARAGLPIYAVAYIKVGGQMFTSTRNVACSFETVLKAVDKKVASLEGPQLEALEEFYTTWNKQGAIKSSWNLENMAAKFGA